MKVKRNESKAKILLSRDYLKSPKLKNPKEAKSSKKYSGYIEDKNQLHEKGLLSRQHCSDFRKPMAERDASAVKQFSGR